MAIKNVNNLVAMLVRSKLKLLIALELVIAATVPISLLVLLVFAQVKVPPLVWMIILDENHI